MDLLVKMLLLLFQIWFLIKMYRSFRTNLFPKQLSFWAELEKSRKKYHKRRKKQEKLPYPKWVDSDPLAHLYFDAPLLWEQGQVYYGYILQADEKLFRFFPRTSHPAVLLYSPDDAINKNPWMLKELGATLLAMKEQDLSSISENLRPMISDLKDEHNRQGYALHFTLEKGESVSVLMASTVVFRKHIPYGRISCSLLPVLAVPGQASSVLILPKRYWAKDFRFRYWNGWKQDLPK